MRLIASTVASIIGALAPQLGYSEEAAHNAPKNWYDGFIFQERSFTFEFIRTLGYASCGAADTGECIATARAIADGDISSWKREWLTTAQRLQALAHSFERTGDPLSAKEVYTRASNYFRTAGFYLCAQKDRTESNRLWQKSVECFLKRSPTRIEIPYEGTTLPGYLLRSEEENAPLLIIHTGFDGTKEELYYAVAQSANERGLNVLVFEGPGQGEVIRKQKLPFRYDWEKVVTPVVDYAMTLDFIDKKRIALYGISLGGYLAARAAAFEHRLAACIVNGGIYDFSENIFKKLPAEVIGLLDTKPAEFDKVIEQEMAKRVEAYWFYHNAMWTMDAKTPGEVMQLLRRYTLKDVIKKIRCPMLVIDSEADLFFQGQPQRVFEELECPKTLLLFSQETSAQAHCQMGAMMISNEKILSWLDKMWSQV